MSTEKDGQLYRSILGPLFDELPRQVRALHTIPFQSIWKGKANVERGTSVLARIAAHIARLPPTGRDQPLTVAFVATRDGELWHRSFDGRVFASHQSADGRNIHERIGPIRLMLLPSLKEGSLHLSLEGLHLFGIPAPRVLVPIVETREFEVDGQYRFEVEARLRLFGLLIRYSGWLTQHCETTEMAATSPATRSSLPRTSDR